MPHSHALCAMICANHVYRYINMASLIPMQALPTMKAVVANRFNAFVGMQTLASISCFEVRGQTSVSVYP